MQTDLPFLDRQERRPSRPWLPRLLATWLGLPTSVRVGPRVYRVAEDIADHSAVRTSPRELAEILAKPAADSDLDPLSDQFPQYGIDRAQAVEGFKHAAHNCLNLLVRIEYHLTVRTLQIACRYRHTQLATSSFLELPLKKTLTKYVEFGFTHRALQPQQKAVVVRSRVIQPIEICNQGPEPSAELKQLMPVSIRPSKTRHLYAEDEANVIEGHLGE